jgi:hypothetical protein
MIPGCAWCCGEGDELKSYMSEDPIAMVCQHPHAPDESAEHPHVCGHRPDLTWCVVCDAWHRDDFTHDWLPL